LFHKHASLLLFLFPFSLFSFFRIFLNRMLRYRASARLLPVRATVLIMPLFHFILHPERAKKTLNFCKFSSEDSELHLVFFLTM